MQPSAPHFHHGRSQHPTIPGVPGSQHLRHDRTVGGIIARLTHRCFVKIGVERGVDIGDHLQSGPLQFAPKLCSNGFDTVYALQLSGLTCVEYRKQGFGNPRPGLRCDIAVSLFGLFLVIGELGRRALPAVELVVSLSGGDLQGGDQRFDGQYLVLCVVARVLLIAGIRRPGVAPVQLRRAGRDRIVVEWRLIALGVGSHSAASSSSMISASTTSSTA